MAANDFIIARTPKPSDFSGINTSSADIPAWMVVKLDTSNLLSGTQEEIGFVLAGSGDYPLGITVEKVPAGKAGRIARSSGFEPVTAETSITAGTVIVPGYLGTVKTTGGGVPQVGQAMQAAAAINDIIYAALDFAKNA